jgi:hypothetical protein
MDPLLAVRTAFGLMTIAALGGVVMALKRFSAHINPPSWLAMLHGLLAAAGLTLLLYFACVATLPGLAYIAILAFLLAAAVGAYLNLRYHANGTVLPAGVVVMHALVAVVGYLCLAVASFHPA